MQSKRFRAWVTSLLALLLAGGLTAACSGDGSTSGLGDAPRSSAASAKGGNNGDNGNPGDSDPGGGDPGSGNPDGSSTPAKLELGATNLNLGNNGSRKMVIRNTGESSLEWSSQTSASWIALSPSRGSVAGGKSQTVQVGLRRAPEGKLKGTATINSNGGKTTVTVTAAVDNAPVISNARLVYSGTSTRVTSLCAGRLVQILADVSDANGLASVQANFTWADGTIESSGGSGLSNMRHESGSTYRSATMAARSDGRYSFLIRASDGTDPTTSRTAKVSKFTLPGCGNVGAFS